MAPDNELAQQLAQRVRGGLNSRGRSQADLAREVGITPKHLNAILQGKASGSVELWNALLTALYPAERPPHGQ